MRTRAAAPILLATTAFVLSSTARLARAQSEDDPEKLIKQGNDMRRAGDNTRAYGYFKRAYDISHTPRAAAQLGLMEQSLERFAESERHFTEALAASDPWIDQNRGVLEDSRKKVRAHLGRVELQGVPSGTTVEIAGQPGVPLPPDGVIWIKPGDSELRIAAPAHEPATKKVSAAAGASVTVSVELPATPGATTAGSGGGPADTTTPPPKVDVVPPPPPPPGITAHGGDEGSGKRVAGLATAGGGAAAVIAGVLFYRSASSKVDTINHAAATGGTYDPSADNWKTLEYTGIGLMVAGGVAVAAGTVLYVLGRNEGSGGATTSDAGTRVGLAPTPRGGWNLQLSGSF
jgi:hypothetical protein